MHYMGIDQYGNTFHGLKKPRRDLLDWLGKKKAEKMYTDTSNGPRHTGYVIEAGRSPVSPRTGDTSEHPTRALEQEETMSYIRKFLDLSTGHLRQSTRDLLDEDKGPTLRFEHPEYGWFVYVSDDVTDAATGEVLPGTDDPVPADLADCFALARQLGCEYIMFDIDGGFHPDLPTYDGEEVEA